MGRSDEDSVAKPYTNCGHSQLFDIKTLQEKKATITHCTFSTIFFWFSFNAVV